MIPMGSQRDLFIASSSLSTDAKKRKERKEHFVLIVGVQDSIIIVLDNNLDNFTGDPLCAELILSSYLTCCSQVVTVSTYLGRAHKDTVIY